MAEIEYIPREAAIIGLAASGLMPHQIDDAAEALWLVPAANVAPVRHAIWRYKTMTVPGGRGQTYAKWSCTACKAKQKERSNYCPNCGAKMDGDGDV